ncbi:peptidyl-prolyl cis-trans isomerase [Robiginitalea sp. 2V75]|uniref:Peptidyl-prolyl cis-trans isomerase n=1 Tax=Robiginitalea marina TaxID=2954105 RepID=A0ABT1AV80_9FLAO|nr:peptidyl-prolyl cis-trans isomerase [Robiginitalea marina]
MNLCRACSRFLLVAPLVLPLFFMLAACDSLWRKEPEKAPLARVGENYLYLEDVEGLTGAELSPGDSAAFVSNLITTWAVRQLLFSRAQINLPEEKIREFESLVSDYRAELYTRAYKEALVAQMEDTLVGAEDLEEFYESEKDNFRLQEKILQLRFIELPRQFLNREEVTERLKRFREEDLKFLDSVGVQFKKLHFNDSLWVPVSRVIREIKPLTYDNEAEYLKKDHFFELEDSTGVYLSRVVDVMDAGEMAPQSYIEPTIRQVLLNRRKMKYLKSLETDLINEALGQKELEIYEKE